MVFHRRGLLALTLTALVASLACRGVIPRHYEYEEELYLALDGSATLYVNGSVPALVALRGLDLDTRPGARLDRSRLRDAYTSEVTDVTRVSASRRAGRRFAHIRIDVSDVRRLSEVAPLAWSSYALERREGAVVFEQRLGLPSGRPVPNAGWKGAELVAFRLHLPSRIQYHNAPSKMVERGNILAWEQSLEERMRGRPIAIEVRLDTESILHRTLWLFASMIGLVVALFAIVIWWLMRRGRATGAAPVS
jgi:hypothetical protein